MHRIKLDSHPHGHTVTNHRGEQFHAKSGKVAKEIHRRECVKLKQKMHNHEETRLKRVRGG